MLLLGGGGGVGTYQYLETLSQEEHREMCSLPIKVKVPILLRTTSHCFPFP
jgi:hypothetical protein